MIEKKKFVVPFLVAVFFWVAGCASTPKIDDSSEPSSFRYSLDAVHSASLAALAVTGFDIKKDEADYVEGFRPRKVGLLVGSGGETVGIWMTAQGAESTSVRVETAKSFVGMMGQKNWDTTILKEIENALTRN